MHLLQVYLLLCFIKLKSDRELICFATVTIKPQNIYKYVYMGLRLCGKSTFYVGVSDVVMHLF